MIRIAAWLPKLTPEAAAGTLEVGPTADAVLAASPNWRIDPAPIRAVLAADARRRTALTANLHSVGTVRGRTDGIQRALDDRCGYRCAARRRRLCVVTRS
jgi:hypothetical protein